MSDQRCCYRVIPALYTSRQGHPLARGTHNGGQVNPWVYLAVLIPLGLIYAFYVGSTVYRSYRQRRIR